MSDPKSDLRLEWKNKVTWSEAVFEDLERFVKTKDEANIEIFSETGKLDDLYGDNQTPTPEPSSKHQEYMQEFASILI